MDRKEFFATSVKGTMGCCALALFDRNASSQTVSRRKRTARRSS
jgi:hypothetical protein